MGLSTQLMQELCKRLKPGARVASMGYPDILATPGAVADIIGQRINDLKCRSDSKEIGSWHGVGHPIPDAHSFFELQGATLDVYDVARHRGDEILCDLNKPLLLRSWKEPVIAQFSYDFVLDIGTLEHCFNITQAAMNMASLLKEGGIILHENPYNWGNHGFYNINPTWYADFYGQKGFELLDLQMIARNCEGDGRNIGEVPRTKRFQYLKSEANMIAIARRVEILPIVFPVQSKYAKMIPAAGVRASTTKEVANG